MPLLLVLPRYWGLDGVWVSVPIADLASSVLTGLALAGQLRGLRSHPLEPAAVEASAASVGSAVG
jgi:hypothetical protein